MNKEIWTDGGGELPRTPYKYPYLVRMYVS